jgi:hypothetical protein
MLVVTVATKANHENRQGIGLLGESVDESNHQDRSAPIARINERRVTGKTREDVLEYH